MDFKTMALSMYPFWILGFFVTLATILAGHKHMVRIEKNAVYKWIKVLCFITMWRYIFFKFFSSTDMVSHIHDNISIIPVPATLFVFWEDACHGLPLFMIKKYIGKRKWLKPFYYLLLFLVMIEFGAGHLYQGLLASIMLSFYVPYSIKMGEKYGFGTVMICHTLFDLTTILSVKYFFGV